MRVVWAYFAALAMGRAVDALDTARGIGLAFSNPDADGHDWDHALDDAFPPADGRAADGANDRASGD